MFKLAFVGDVSFTGSFFDKCKSDGDFVDDEIRRLFFSSDYVVCNLEGACGDLLYNSLRPNIRVVSPSGAINALSNVNVTIFNLANNHVFDCGIEGFDETVYSINKLECNHFGAGRNIDEASSILYLEKNDIKISLIGVAHEEGLCASENGPGVFCAEKSGLSYLKRQIKHAKKHSDWVVVNYHGGEEFTKYPLPRRRRLLRKIAKYGPDMVVCHHPHVLQGVEKVSGCNIFYSLGNFLFDLSCHEGIDYVDEGVVLEFSFEKDSYKYNFYPTMINRDEAIVERGGQHILQRIEEVSCFHRYYARWLTDCYRVVFDNKNNRSTDNHKHTDNTNIITICKKIIGMLKKRNKRCVVASAHIYKICKKVTWFNINS